jgi:hypothetical protein
MVSYVDDIFHMCNLIPRIANHERNISKTLFKVFLDWGETNLNLILYNFSLSLSGSSSICKTELATKEVPTQTINQIVEN